MRSIPVEWGLFGQGDWNYTTNSQFIYNFWVNGTERAKPYEGIYTVGMRGDGDCKTLFQLDLIDAYFLSSATFRDHERRYTREGHI